MRSGLQETEAAFPDTKESYSIYPGFSEDTDHQIEEYLISENTSFCFISPHKLFRPLLVFKLPQFSRTTRVLDKQNTIPVPHKIHSVYLLIRSKPSFKNLDKHSPE